MFNQEFGAEFTDFVGKVFKGFDAETRHPPFEVQSELGNEVACVDYGFSIRTCGFWFRSALGAKSISSMSCIKTLHLTNSRMKSATPWIGARFVPQLLP